MLAELNHQECILQISKKGTILPAMKAKTLDFTPILFTNKNQILAMTPPTSFTKIVETISHIKKQLPFSLSSSISLKKIMISQSSSRKKVNNHE